MRYGSKTIRSPDPRQIRISQRSRQHRQLEMSAAPGLHPTEEPVLCDSGIEIQHDFVFVRLWHKAVQCESDGVGGPDTCCPDKLDESTGG